MANQNSSKVPEVVVGRVVPLPNGDDGMSTRRIAVEVMMENGMSVVRDFLIHAGSPIQKGIFGGIASPGDWVVVATLSGGSEQMGDSGVVLAKFHPDFSSDRRANDKTDPLNTPTGAQAGITRSGGGA